MSCEISCATCDDFGWVPQGEDAGWYQRQWRLLLDPTVRWLRCPACGERQQPQLSRVQDCLARWLRTKVLAESTAWHTQGAWRCASWHGCALAYHEQGVVIIGSGSGNPHPWLLISDLGVMQDLNSSTCAHHIQRAGLPLPLLLETPPSSNDTET